MRFASLPLAFLLSMTTAAGFGCGGDDDGPNLDHLQSVAILDDGTVSVEMLSEADLAVGRNLVWYRVTDMASGDVLDDATVTQNPIMDMMDFSHSCPEVDPSGADDNGVYPGKIVFIMPSGDEGTWKDTVTVVRAGETAEHEITFANLTVAGTDKRKAFDVTKGEQMVRTFVTFNELAPWAQGANNYVLTVHERETMMSFPPLNDVTVSVTVTPEGGTAADATAPSFDADGEYLGTIDLPAPGVYTITFTLERGSEVIGTVSWERTI